MGLFDDQTPEEEVIPTTIRVQRRLVGRLDAIAQRETELRKASGKKPPVISRNDVVARFLERACDEYEKAAGAEEKKPKR